MTQPFDITADLDTPVSAYLKLKPFRPRFLLESVEGGERLGRFSFIGFGEAKELRLDAEGLTLAGERRARPSSKDELLGALRHALRIAPRPTAFDGEHTFAGFHGGLVGVAGYDLVRYFERLKERVPAAEGPDAHYLAAPSLLVFDHLTRRAALLHAGSEAERVSLRREVTRALRGGLPGPAWPASVGPPEPSLTEAGFLERVARTKEHIAAGDIYQLVLSVRFAGPADVDPFEAYRALRQINPSPYMFFLDLGDRFVIGSSPEALVKLSGERATMRPIAGTRPRGVDSAADARLEAELLADPKESAEHVMLVDLARNDLGRVAAAGSVHVAPFRSIERYSHVMHLVSGVEGTLLAGRDAFDLFAAAFPAGTLVGAPKVRAMEIIDTLEPSRRGFYGGTVGYFGVGCDMDQAITIRTLVLSNGRYSYQAGAGIVDDSDPAAEHREVLAKSAVMRRALELAKEGL